MSPDHMHQAAGGGPRWEVADIFRAHGEAYRKTHPLPRSHLKVMRAIERCRTVLLGGHIQQCDSCSFQRQAYNSCRNRHCPKCGSLDKARWLEDRKAEVLPVGYFHLVFTLPHELNPLALSNKKVVCDILFKAVSQTLLEFARTRLGGLLGFICVLHTWDQNAARSLPSPLLDSSGRVVVRSLPLDSGSQRVSLSRPCAQPCLPWQVP